MSYLYPAEDNELMASSKVSLLLRLYYGFLDREGPRASEARDLQICDVNLAVEAVRLDKNKTDEPRAWKLSPGVAEALRRWLKRYRKRAKPTDLLFQDARGRRPPEDQLAKALRRDLKKAGVLRRELHTNNRHRKHIRGHDLRATFITVNLANGKTETWIADRTGHKSSQMIYRYKRQARTHAELDLGELKPLVDAIPELAGEDE